MPPLRPVALVVDDDPFVRELIRAVLGEAGWDVVEAGNGDEAIAQFRDGAFTAVVLDCRMPVRDGPATHAWIRAKEPHLAVLFVSGHPTRALDEILRRDPRCRLLAKPFSPARLLASLEALGASASSLV